MTFVPSSGVFNVVVAAGPVAGAMGFLLIGLLAAAALVVVLGAERKRQTQCRHAIVRELLGPGAPDDDLRACVLSVQGQCLFYWHCQPVLTRLFPGLSFGREQVPGLAEHITRFSLAGIRAIARAREAGAT